MKYEFPKISRARLKVIDADIKTIGDGTTPEPTEEEKAWIDIITCDAPELENKKKKLSVCTLADIVEYDNNMVKFLYDGITYAIKKPTNSLQVARARERSITDAVEALNYQHCICAGAVPISKDFSGISVEVIGLISAIAESFFFMPYL
jgi:hypothetical protein